MSRMDEACENLFQHVNGAVLCSAIDLDAGIVLGLFPSAVEMRRAGGVLATSAARLIRGLVIGELVRALEGITEQFSERPYLREAQLTTEQHRLFCRTVNDDRVLVLLVTTRDVSVGMGWAQLKAAIGSFSATSS